MVRFQVRPTNFWSRNSVDTSGRYEGYIQVGEWRVGSVPDSFSLEVVRFYPKNLIKDGGR